jgi:hypothetical protein
MKQMKGKRGVFGELAVMVEVAAMTVQKIMMTMRRMVKMAVMGTGCGSVPGWIRAGVESNSQLTCESGWTSSPMAQQWQRKGERYSLTRDQNRSQNDSSAMEKTATGATVKVELD